MRSTTILHVTDLHFGSSREGDSCTGQDNAVSESFRTEVAGSGVWERFTADVRVLCAQAPINLIACTGDLGCEGDEETLNHSVRYLATLANRLSVPPDRVLVSPGNHDLNRKAKPGQELEQFCRLCEAQGFSYAERATPGVTNVNGIPVIALNTCLGGTEHALHGLPQKYWEEELATLRQKESDDTASRSIAQSRSDLEYQVQAMDIPAIGIAQRELCHHELVSSDSRCAVIMMHHSPLPTSKIDIRPYASIIDSGPLLLRLMEDGRHVVVLHGHTHSRSGLSVNIQQNYEGGFIASIGSKGFSDRGNAAASLIHLITSERGAFVKLDVFFIEGSPVIFQRSFQYSLNARPADSFQPDWDLSILPKNEPLSLTEVADLVDRAPDDTLAEDLVMLEPTSVRILGKGEPLEDWRITRIR